MKDESEDLTPLAEQDGEVIRKEVARLLELDAKECADLLLDSPAAEQLVRAVPETDFYLLIKEVPDNDAIALLSIASDSQWQHVLDLDLWREDRIVPAKITHWIRMLLACGWECAARWVSEIDPHLILLMLKKRIRVYLPDYDYSIVELELESLWTLDNWYFIEFLDNESAKDYQRLLRLLAQVDSDLYRALMEHLMSETESSVEAYEDRLRWARLEDFGFLGLDEAITIYQYQSPERIESIKTSMNIRTADFAPSDMTPPHFPLKLARGEDLVGAALDAISDEAALDSVKMALASLGNQIFTADLKTVEGKDTFIDVLQKAKSYITIGLERLGAAGVSEAAVILSRVPLKTLFQIGFSGLLERAWRANRIWVNRWTHPMELKPSMLGSPWSELLEGLKQKRPTLFDPKGALHRRPESLAELLALDSELDRMEAAGAALQVLLKALDLKRIKESLYGSDIGLEEPLQWKAVLFTAFAGWVIDENLLFCPLTMEEVRRFFKIIWKSHERPRKFNPEITTRWRETVEREIGEGAPSLTVLTDFIFPELEEELRGISLKDLDARFLPFIILPEDYPDRNRP